MPKTLEHMTLRKTPGGFARKGAHQLKFFFAGASPMSATGVKITFFSGEPLEDVASRLIDLARIVLEEDGTTLAQISSQATHNQEEQL